MYIMDSKYLEKLDFNKVCENLEKYAKTYIGKDICLNLLPLESEKEIVKALKQTTEASTLIYRKGNLPVDEIENIIPQIKKLNASSSLSIKELLDLAHILKISRELKEYFSSEEIDMSEFEYLNSLFEHLYINVGLENNIYSKLLGENTVDDNASTVLKNIRKNLRNKEQEIRNKLNSFLRTKYVQESVITMRSGRFVVPVKNEYRSEVKGFIHDISSSGSTVFIEPVSVFDLNNDLSNLKNDESIEIERILMELSSLFFEITDMLQNNINLIGIIDFIFAKAKYSNDIDATEPTINSEKIINLKNAWHPLIDKKIAVKNDIKIGEDFSNLIITGPNTGGKTVTIKTIGLLALMAMSGMHIPAKEGSSVFVFDNVFADIGDEQSITNSLSTFSSHMTTIAKILENATEHSLVLLDELGSGTDPVQGSCLAISILEELNYKKAITISTTHYPELKHYALVNDNFENASVEFNIDTLSPTYRLLVGVPGSSNAFDISEKLGINKKIIDRANELLSSDEINIEELLKNIYEDKKEIENEKQKIVENSKKIEELKYSLENDFSSLRKQEQDIINDAKVKARDILLDAKEEANDIIKEIESSANTKETEQARNKLNKKIKDLAITKNYVVKGEMLNAEDIKSGMDVYIPALNQQGTIISVNKNKACVQIGFMKTYFEVGDLQKVDRKIKKEKEFKTKKNREFSVKSIPMEINVIGQTVEEACFVVDKYLDDCALNGLATTRIVHGKGSGALRTGIHKFLKTHPHVKSFRVGTFGEGEMGVTIVEIK